MADPRSTPLRILVVDDNPLLLDLIQEMLKDIGNMLVFTAADGVQGLEQFEAVRPDCMVIDVNMPGLNGYQLVRAIRGDPDSAGMPLIILTAMAQDNQQFAGFAAGVDQYLIKPVTLDVLAAAIQSALAHGEAEREQRWRNLADEI